MYERWEEFGEVILGPNWLKSTQVSAMSRRSTEKPNPSETTTASRARCRNIPVKLVHPLTARRPPRGTWRDRTYTHNGDRKSGRLHAEGRDGEKEGRSREGQTGHEQTNEWGLLRGEPRQEPRNSNNHETVQSEGENMECVRREHSEYWISAEGRHPNREKADSVR